MFFLEPVTQISLFWKIFNFLTGNKKPKYVYPEISIEQGCQSLEILCYQGIYMYTQSDSTK